MNHAYDASVLVSAESNTTAGIVWMEAEQTRMTGAFLRNGKLEMLVDSHVQLSVPWTEDKVWLRLLDDRHDLSMFYGRDWKTWIRFDFGIAYDGRLAERITLVASGSGKGTFENFRYGGHDFGQP